MITQLKSILRNNRHVKIQIIAEATHYHGDYEGTPWIIQFRLKLQQNKNPVLRVKSHDYNNNNKYELVSNEHSNDSCMLMLKELIATANSNSGTSFDFAKHGIIIPCKIYQNFYHGKISLFKPETITIKHYIRSKVRLHRTRNNYHV